jgi:hypothetical protein
VTPIAQNDEGHENLVGRRMPQFGDGAPLHQRLRADLGYELRAVAFPRIPKHPLGAERAAVRGIGPLRGSRGANPSPVNGDELNLEQFLVGHDFLGLLDRRLECGERCVHLGHCLERLA